MDEPCSALDPTSTRRIEETIAELAAEVTIVIVTHNMQQAQRVSSACAFFLADENEPGHIVEAGRHAQIFDDPTDPRTARLRPRPVRMMPHRAHGIGVARGARLAGRARRAGARRRVRRPDDHAAPARPGCRSRSTSGAPTARGSASSVELPGRRLDRRPPVLHASARSTSPRRRSRSCPTSCAQLQGSSTSPYQYLPDVAGGTAVMYNLKDTAGQPGERTCGCRPRPSRRSSRARSRRGTTRRSRRQPAACTCPRPR